MPRITCLLLLALTLTACVRPGRLNPPGLALGAFRVGHNDTDTHRTLHGVGLVLQPGRLRLGLIREQSLELPRDRPTHITGQTFEFWSFPDPPPFPSPRGTP